MNKYTTITKIEDYLITTVVDYFKPRVEVWIEQITKMIEEETQRVFIADTVSSWKDYRVKYSTDVLMIDEAIEIETLEIDGEEIDTTTYENYPLNETPKNKIQLLTTSSYYFTPRSFLSGEGEIRVKAKWGYSEEAPADIVLATTILVAGIISRQLREGIISQEKIGNYSVSYKEDKGEDYKQALKIIESYKKVII